MWKVVIMNVSRKSSFKGGAANISTILFDLDNTLIHTTEGDNCTCRTVGSQFFFRFAAGVRTVSKIALADFFFLFFMREVMLYVAYAVCG